MKRVGSFITVSVMSLLFAVGALGYAGAPQQQSRDNQQQQQDKHAQQRIQKQLRQDQRTQRQAEQRQRQQDRQVQQGVRQLQRTPQQRREQQAMQRQVWHQHRANHWDVEHCLWRQRGGYNGYRIPDVYFYSHYGPGHWFRVYRMPFMIVGGFPRFQYAGYWFTLVDPYPEYWGPYWYETDDVYVDYYMDGYYLYNRRFPGRLGVAVIINF